MFAKNFIGWIRVKQKLDRNNAASPLVHPGDIWWCCVGENIGVEVSGKSKKFARPVLILKAFNQNSFLGIPLTSVPRSGKNYVHFRFNGREQFAMLSQIRTFSHKRLDTHIG